MDLIITILPVITKDLPISPRLTPYNFLSRCKFSTLTTRQPMVEFYLLTLPRFPLRKKEHKSYFGKNRTHGFRTSRCAGYLLDHSGEEGYHYYITAFNRRSWFSDLIIDLCNLVTFFVDQKKDKKGKPGFELIRSSLPSTYRVNTVFEEKSERI